MPKQKPKPVYTDDFEAFWRVFPHRQGDPKKPAYISWRKLDVEDRESAKAGASEWESVWRHVSNRQFVPQAVTWLNQRRWESPPSRPDRETKPVDNFDIGDYAARVAREFEPPQ